MTTTPVALQPGVALGTSDTALYTAPANTKAMVTTAVFTNIDTVARLVNCWIKRSGGTPNTKVISAQSVGAGKSYVSPELVNQVLAAGDQIIATADAGAVVNAVVSGFEIV